MSSGVQINPHKLTEARQARALNISKLAELVGVTRQAISKYEQGSSKVSVDVLNKLSSVLEFPVSFFINLTMIYHILKAQYFTEVLKLLKKLLGV